VTVKHQLLYQSTPNARDSVGEQKGAQSLPQCFGLDVRSTGALAQPSRCMKVTANLIPCGTGALQLDLQHKKVSTCMWEALTNLQLLREM